MQSFDPTLEAKVIPFVQPNVGMGSTPQTSSVTPFKGIEIGDPVRRVKRTAEDKIGELVAACMNGHILFERGISLRREAEEFIGWITWMGEGTESPKWGETQRTFAADWRARNRQAAADLKKEIEIEWRKNPQAVIEEIFSKKYWRYPADDEVTLAARRELQIEANK